MQQISINLWCKRQRSQRYYMLLGSVLLHRYEVFALCARSPAPQRARMVTEVSPEIINADPNNLGGFLPYLLAIRSKCLLTYCWMHADKATRPLQYYVHIT